MIIYYMEKKGKSGNICTRKALLLVPLLSVLFLSLSIKATARVSLIIDSLNLRDSGRKIENIIDLYTSPSGYESIKAVTGKKILVNTRLLVINGDTIEPERINTRGESTLSFRRKSFHFSLKSNALIKHGSKTKTLRKFYVISLTMDKNYKNNRLAFGLMETAGIFNLFYSFCELRINGESAGISMVIERPEDWAFKKKDSPLLIRRGYNHHIDKITTDKKIGKDEAQKYTRDYNQVYKSLRKYKGEALYDTLSRYLEIKDYMKWIAFNLIIRNGDYSDEIYFYGDPGLNKLNIIPWDYDDLFFLAPHEGNAARKSILRDKLIFSAEEQLDKKIAQDSFLYEIYLEQLKVLLGQLTPEIIKQAFEDTYAELYPYFSDPEIISLSAFDLYGKSNFTKLKSDIFTSYEYLINSRNYFLNYLANMR